MVQIDIDADLNWVDDEGRNLARRPAGLAGLAVGDDLAAGRPGFWSWVRVEELSPDWIFFRQIVRPVQ